MRRPPRFALLEQHHFAGGAVGGDWISRRQDRTEGEASVGIRVKLAAQVVIGLRRVLVFVHARG